MDRIFAGQAGRQYAFGSAILVFWKAFRKSFSWPSLPLSTAKHVLRILVAEGKRGREVLEDFTWRLFMLTEQDVATTLGNLAREGEIHFEKVGAPWSCKRRKTGRAPMSSHDWRWKIGEAIERIRTRYDYIGRKTGAPFLAVLYPPEAELAVLKEWHTQTNALRPEFDVRTIDALDITQKVSGLDRLRECCRVAG